MSVEEAFLYNASMVSPITVGPLRAILRRSGVPARQAALSWTGGPRFAARKYVQVAFRGRTTSASAVSH